MAENYQEPIVDSENETTLGNAIVAENDLAPNDDPRLDPILPSQMTSAQKLPSDHDITMAEAMRQYRITQTTIDQRIKGPDTNFWGNAAKGVKDFGKEIAAFPDKFNAAVYRAFDGHIFPDMSEDEAVRLMEASTRLASHDQQMRNLLASYEGADDSIVRPFFSGAAQVISYGLVGALTGGVGIGVMAGVQEATDISQEMAENYMKENDGSLRDYKGSEDAIFAAAHGAVSGYIESFFGVERLFTNAIRKTGIKKIGEYAARAALGEGTEEFLQEGSKYLFENMAGRNDRTFGEFLKDAVVNAAYGAALGGAFGGAMYYPNVRRIKKALKQQGYTEEQANVLAPAIVNEAKEGILKEVDDRTQIREHYGEQWDNLKNKIVTALENAGWRETNPDIDLEKYAEDNADDIVRPLFRFSNKFGIDTRDLIQLADIDVIDNAIYLRPGDLGTPETIANRIKEKQAQVKRLTTLAKTGAGDPEAKRALNTQIELLQKYYEKLTGDRFSAARRVRAGKAKMDAEILATTAPAVSETIAAIDTTQMSSGEPTTQIREKLDGQPFVYVGDKQLPVEYKVVPMDEVIASHIGQDINTRYSLKELQNRAQRGSRTDVSILQSRAAKIQPENLGIAYNTQNGAPVVNDKGEVIAGNGRYEVLRMTNEKGRARYNKYLESLGLDLTGIKDPILVRVMHNLTPEQQIAVADASNVSATSAFNNASQAAQDAKLLKGTTGVTDFLNKIPIESRQGLFLANDRVNKVALDRRYNDALMMWLLNGDTALYEELYLMGGITQKIQSALNQSIPGLMSLENQYPDVGIRKDLANALKRYPQVARSQDFALTVSQVEIDDGRPDLFNENVLLYALNFGKNTKTWEGTGPDRLQVGLTLSEFFDTYTRKATTNQENIGQVDMFGQPLAVEQSRGDLLAETLTLAFPREFQDGAAVSRDMKAVFLTRAQTAPTQLNQIDLLDTVQPSLFADDTSTASAVRNLPWEKPVNVSNPTFFNRMPDANDIEIARNNGIDSFLILDKNEVPSKLVLLDGSVIGLKPGAKIPSGKDLYKPSTPRQLFQTEERNLVVTHGISLRNLQKVLDLGGMAAPSIAISSINEPLTDFGTITLVGNKDIIDPAKSANRVYDRDIWSPTMPFKTYPKAKTKAANAFRDKFKSTFVKVDDEANLGEVLYYAQNSARPEQAVQKFEWSRGAKLYYVENVLGKKIDIPTRSVNKDDIWGLHPDQEFIDALKDVDSMAPMDEVIKKVTDAARALINRTDYGKYTKEYRETFLSDYPEDYSGNFNRMDSILYQTKKYAQNIGKTEVDTSALGRILDEYANNDQNYQKWAESQIEEMLGSPKVEVGKKLLDWNLENVTKAMLKAGTVNGQNSLVYGVGKVISAGSTRFTSIKGIKEAAKNLKTKKDAAELTDALGARMQDFTNKFMSDSDFTNSMEQKEAAFRALGTLAASGNPTKERLQSVLNYELANKEIYPDELLQEGVDIAKATKEVVRYYFEAKPQRSVLLTEFSGAVMPDDSSYDEMAQKLKDLGLQVERTDNLQQGIRNIENSVGGILFQAAYSGSRVDYDRPSLEAIGSGEGAAAHGWGLYYALNPEIADNYRWKFTANQRQSKHLFGLFPTNFVIDAKHYYTRKLDDGTTEFIETTTLSNNKTKTRKLSKTEYMDIFNAEKEKEDARILHDNTLGQVHEVDIPEMDVLLDEQKMLIDQSEFVQKKIWEINDKLNLGIKDSGIRGGEIYQRIANAMDEFILDENGNVKEYNDIFKQASQYLDKEGIKGITYDGRQDGRCFVIFNPESVKVLRKKFDELGNQLFQGRKVNGFYDPELEVIVLGRSSNTGTLPHEMSHYWANTIFNLVKSGKYNNNPDFMAQAMGMFRMLGVGMNQDTLTRDQQEMFASMTEAVIFGMAPIPQGTELPMTAFLNWVPQKYKSILDIGYRNSEGRIVNPILDKQAVEWFNAWYANGTLPSIDASPLMIENSNGEQDGRIIPSSTEVMKVRVTEMTTESDNLKRARTEQMTEVTDSTPASERAAAAGAEVKIESQPGNIERSEPPAEKKRGIMSYLIPGRGTNTREGMFAAARDYISKERAHAEEIAFGSPATVPNDTGVDRAILIRALMEEYKQGDPEYAELYHNLAETVSLAGKTPGLSNDMNFQFYNEAVRRITDGMEGVAAIKYAGTRNLNKARRTFNSDIDAFIQEHAAKILNTAPDTDRREMLIKQMLAEASVKFGGDNAKQLFQEDLRRGRSIKSADRAVFIEWANREVRKMLKAAPDTDIINRTMELSEKAEKARKYLDSNDNAEVQAAGKTIREWQLFVAEKEVPETWYSKLIGSWYPKAMLYNINTHLVNMTGNTFNYGIVHAAVAAQYKQGNKVSKQSLDAEKERLHRLYDTSLMNLAAMENPTSPTLLHGEQYNPREGKSTIGKVADFSMDLLGKEDAIFRIRAYLDALGHIATADAVKTGGSPTELFNEYKKINNPKGTRAYEARLEALRISDIAVFQQTGRLSTILKKVRDALNMGQRGGLGTLLGPFVKTPANIVEQGAGAILAPITATYHGLTGKWTIQDTLNTGYFALACILTMGLMADYEPPYEVPQRYDPNKPYDSIRIRGTDTWIKLDTFAAAAVPLRIIASIATGKGLGIGGAFDEIPLIGDLVDAYSEAARIEKDPYKQGTRFVANWAYNRVNTAVPAIIKYTLAAMHPADLNLDELDLGLPKTGIGRKIGRQYGLDGGDTTTNDILRIFFNRLKVYKE